MRKRPVCIYIDNSNIFIGGKTAAEGLKEDPSQLRIDFENFLFLITGGGMEFDELVWEGSGGPELEPIFAGLKEKGIDVQLIPSSSTGENETVDQAIQLAMYRHSRKYRDDPGTMVLCTGDGKGFHEEKGFLYDVKGFAEDGWQLVLYSWDCVCHGKLKEFAKQHGVYIRLEDFYRSITFLTKGRHAEKVRL
jgi:hypothetical protein